LEKLTALPRQPCWIKGGLLLRGGVREKREEKKGERERKTGRKGGVVESKNP